MLTARILVLSITCLLVASCSSSSTDPVSLSYAELERSIRDSRDCLVSQGIKAEVVYDEVQGFTGVTFDSRSAESEVESCIAPVEEANSKYLKTKVPTGAERDQQIGELIKCFESIGITTVTPADFASEIENVIIQKLVEHNIEVEGEEFPFEPGLDCLAQYELLFPSRLG